MKNPIDDKKDSYRMLRGGSWSTNAIALVLRSVNDPANRNAILGFRIVRNNDEKSNR
jgi:formylglycine-generating enzyme required for sulfatase activity